MGTANSGREEPDLMTCIGCGELFDAADEPQSVYHESACADIKERYEHLTEEIARRLRDHAAALRRPTWESVVGKRVRYRGLFTHSGFVEGVDGSLMRVRVGPDTFFLSTDWYEVLEVLSDD